MERITLARIIHIIAIVLWIGGVAMVTTVIIPAIKKMSSKDEQLKTFERIESRFSTQAKITTLITGLSGFYMLYALNGWHRYLDYHYWWIHAMTFVWLLFTVILYVLEPLILHKLFKTYVAQNPEKTFSFLHKAHWVLLILSLITIVGAVAGSHGWFFIN
jgi:uncharacterized membrane protein